MARAVACWAGSTCATPDAIWAASSTASRDAGAAVLLIHGVVGGWDGAPTWRTFVLPATGASSPLASATSAQPCPRALRRRCKLTPSSQSSMRSRSRRRPFSVLGGEHVGGSAGASASGSDLAPRAPVRQRAVPGAAEAPAARRYEARASGPSPRGGHVFMHHDDAALAAVWEFLSRESDDQPCHRTCTRSPRAASAAAPAASAPLTHSLGFRSRAASGRASE